MAVSVQLPMTKEEAARLRAGDSVLLTGTIYTARDAAHKRIYEMMHAGEPLPFDLDGASIYYVGPSPAQAGMPVGSAGPTTSSRCDKYTPEMLDAGLPDGAYRRNTQGWFKPCKPVAEFLEDYSMAGGTHHSAMVYDADIREIRAFGKMMGFEVIEIR